MTVGIAIYLLYTYKAIPCLLVGKQGIEDIVVYSLWNYNIREVNTNFRI